MVTCDESYGVILNGDILITGDQIGAIGPGLAHPDAETIDATGMIAMPGFVDSHRHTWEAPFHAIGADWNAGQYLTGIHLGLSKYMRPEDTYNGILLGALDALDTGITTLLDWSHNMETPEHADASVQALRDSGMRAVLAHGGGYTMWNAPSDVPHTRDALRVRSRHFPDNDGRRNLVTMALAARGPDYSTMRVSEMDWQLAREMDTRITVHLGAGEWGRRRPVARMHDRGMTGPEVTYVHCNVLAEDELKIIADTGGTVSTAPDVEIELGMGFPAAGRMVHHGIRPSLSLDVVVTTAGDMFGAMRTTLQIERALQYQPDEFARAPVSTKDVLDFATLQGARTVGLGHVTGSLTPGKKADLLLLSTSNLALTPMNNPIGAIVQVANPGHVDSVFIDGKRVKRDGRLLRSDIDAVRRSAVETRDYVIAQAQRDPGLRGAKVGGDWFPPEVSPPAQAP